MRFDVLTLLPEFFETPLRQGVIGRAISKGLLEVHTHNIRDFAPDRHRTTDDAPYGGGAGMVMKPGPIERALESALKAAAGLEKRPVVILATPQGTPFNHKIAKGLADEEGLVIICGRYEGVDERVRGLVDIEVSIGDYVLTGGEIAALVIIDSVGRLKPKVLGAEDGTEDDSFADGLLEYPQYTRPPEFKGLKVPEVLLSGDHREIERWRRLESIRRTFQRRPELLDKTELTDEERLFVKRLKADPQRGF